MQDRPKTPGVVVYQHPAAPGPPFALHVAGRPPGEASPSAFAAIAMPLPAHPDPVVEFVSRTLYLPQVMLPKVEVAPRGVEAGLQQMWQRDPETGLSMPAGATQELILSRHTRSKILIVPGEVGLDFDPLLLGELAWDVLARFPPEIVAGIAAGLACRAEIAGAGLSPYVAAFFQFGEPLNTRLMNLALGGEVFLYHDALRWIVRETAAATANGTWTARGGADLGFDVHSQAAARTVFPSLGAGGIPRPQEIYRAFWVLHQVFTFSAGAFDATASTHEALLSMMTSIVYGQPQWGAWAPRLERWQQMFATDDGDPAVVDARLRPSVFRAMFRSKVGLEISEWLALLWFLSIRYVGTAISGSGPRVESIPTLLSAGLQPPLGVRFRTALHTYGVADLTSLGNVVLAELGATPYGGLGTLPTVEGTAMRNAPLLAVAADQVVPLGVHLLAERGVALPRLIVGQTAGSGGYQEVNGLLGKFFEAHVRELALGARPRHQVVTEAEIAQIVPDSSKRCDGIIVDGDHWLLIEAGLQTLPQRIGAGEVASIQNKCAAYHAKANQIDATRPFLGTIARRRGLMTPRVVTILVVTETLVPFTVVLAEELRHQNPRRNPLFVAGLDEFEALVAAGANSSIPGLVAQWQQREQPVPLFVGLYEVSKLRPVARPQPTIDAATWLAHLGTTMAA